MPALYLKRELSVVDAVHQVGVDYHPTDRKQEGLIGGTMGLTSKELAMRMNISPNTVKPFLRSITIKMSVTTRSGIVGKLVDQNGELSDI
jgi:DNA-binding NarL/FixJ family response regulator